MIVFILNLYIRIDPLIRQTQNFSDIRAEGADIRHNAPRRVARVSPIDLR